MSDPIDAFAYLTGGLRQKAIEQCKTMHVYTPNPYFIDEDRLRGLACEKIDEMVKMFRVPSHLLKPMKETKMSIQQVVEFHNKFGVPVNDTPGFPSKEVLKFRLETLAEELEEINNAAKRGDLEDFLDGLVDLVYFAMGTAHVCALPFNDAFREVHEANMRKVNASAENPGKRGFGGDIVKPEDWVGPNMKKIIAKAVAHAKEQIARTRRENANRIVRGSDDYSRGY